MRRREKESRPLELLWSRWVCLNAVPFLGGSPSKPNVNLNSVQLFAELGRLMASWGELNAWVWGSFWLFIHQVGEGNFLLVRGEAVGGRRVAGLCLRLLWNLLFSALFSYGAVLMP